MVLTPASVVKCGISGGHGGPVSGPRVDPFSVGERPGVGAVVIVATVDQPKVGSPVQHCRVLSKEPLTL
jgi:hypothetical protein